MGGGPLTVNPESEVNSGFSFMEVISFYLTGPPLDTQTNRLPAQLQTPWSGHSHRLCNRLE